MRVWLPVGAVAACLALALFLAALLVPKKIDSLVDDGLRKQTVWQPDSPPDVYAHFARQDNPGDPPMYANYFVFNLTNVAEVQRGCKPRLQQLGPYTYIKHERKEDIRFDVEGHVHFKPYTFYTGPAQELTNGSVDDMVWTINVPLLGVLAQAMPDGGKEWLQVAIKAALLRLDAAHTDGLFMRRSVRELLFGYEDPLLATLHWLVPGTPTRFGVVANDSSAAAAAAGASTVVNTGAHNISGVLDTEVWANLSVVTSWAPPHLEAVRGTDASQFRPRLALGDGVQVWSEDLYRAITFVANESVSLHGVDLLRFVPDTSQAAPDPRFYQTIEGLMNITSPTAGGPAGEPDEPGPALFLSQAHFCGADAGLQENVTGLACNTSLHVTSLDVEPLSGITMRAAKRLMLSSEYGKVSYNFFSPHVRHTFLPIFWGQEASEATEEQCKEFSGQVYRARRISSLVHGVGLVAATALLFIALVCLTEPLWNAGHAFREEPGALQEPLLAEQGQAGAADGADAAVAAGDKPHANGPEPVAEGQATAAGADQSPSVASQAASAQGGPVQSHQV